MRRRLLISILTIVAVVAAVLLFGMGLPVEHVATQRDWFAVPPDRAFGTITDVARYPVWRRDMDSVQILDSGGHLAWREHGSFGRITFEAVEIEPPRRFVARITDQDLGFGGRWTYTLSPERNGTTVTITENGEITNPLFRVVSRVTGYAGTMRAYLEDLHARLDSVNAVITPGEGRS